jgi:type III pantothenate kinase
MLWAVDVGNTTVVAGLMDGERVRERRQAPSSALVGGESARKWADGIKRVSSAEGVIVSSVVPKVNEAISKAVFDAMRCRALFIRPDMEFGMRLNVKKPMEVGADRIVNALAARKLYGTPVIVADFGTATTFDVVDRHGDYCGGAILPGLQTGFRALHAYTAQLPSAEFRPAKRAIGRNTLEAMRSGVWFGAIGQVREILLRLRKEVGAVVPAVATGGFSRSFEQTDLFHHVVPDLTLVGLACVWKRLHG